MVTTSYILLVVEDEDLDQLVDKALLKHSININQDKSTTFINGNAMQLKQTTVTRLHET